MLVFRSISGPAGFYSKQIVVRGTATYTYKTYGDPDGPNYHLIQYLIQEQQREEVSSSNPFKARAIATAIKSIHELDYPISSPKDFQNLRGVGEGISHRIMEFLGKTRKRDFVALGSENRKELEKSRAMQELQRVSGIGPIKARALVERGCMSLRQLKEPQYQEMLPRTVNTSFQYFTEIQERVSRPQAEAFMRALLEILPPEFESHLTGSYRRGHNESSDIDVLLLHPSYTAVPRPHLSMASRRESWRPHKDPSNLHLKHRPSETLARPPLTLLRDAVITPLSQRGFIASAMSAGSSKWQGIVKIDTESGRAFRRLDFNLMPQPSKAAALLAFTGDVEFNRTCRKRAARFNLHLNEFGLWRERLRHTDTTGVESSEFKEQESSPGCVKEEDQSQWELVETPDEAALLRELGMGYIIPERRNFGNISMNLRSDRKKGEGAQPRQGPSAPSVRREDHGTTMAGTYPRRGTASTGAKKRSRPPHLDEKSPTRQR